ncbi:MAG: energy transducer TonB [Pyrinomonadaceae bacterium]
MNKLDKIFLIIGLLLLGFQVGYGQNAEPGPPRNPETVPIKIKSRPSASHTTEARRADVQGVVRLRVTFLATGKIGNIDVVFVSDEEKFEKYGLTKQAIKAAKKIKFEPAKRDGNPVSIVKTVEYSFSTY